MLSYPERNLITKSHITTFDSDGFSYRQFYERSSLPLILLLILHFT